MWSGLLAQNTADKLVAVCAGLAVCSGVLLLAALTELDARLPAVLLDDVVLGVHLKPAWLMYAAELGMMAASLILLTRRPVLSCALAFGWSLLMLVDTVADIAAFAADPYLIAEEAAFALLYAYLLGLVIVYAYDMKMRPSRIADVHADG